MAIYDRIARYYEKWSSLDLAYQKSQSFYVRALCQKGSGDYLDLGIGTGRIALEAVCSAPISVTGIDTSSEMLAICKEKYEALSGRKGTIHLEQADATHLEYHEKFDGAIFPFHAVSHLLTEASIRSLFEGVFRALKPGGWFLLDDFSLSREHMPDWINTQEPVEEYRDAEVNIQALYQCDFDRNQMHVSVFVNNELYENFVAHWRVPSEIVPQAEQAGFEILALMGDFDGSPWTECSTERVWLFRKPGDPSAPLPSCCSAPEQEA